MVVFHLSCKYIQQAMYALAIPNFLISMQLCIDKILIHISNFNCYGVLFCKTKIIINKV